MSGLRVALIAGGPSAEAEVSRTSARGVFAALERAGHAPTLFELDDALATKLLSGSFDVAFPVTTSENPNPNWHGCLDRNA